MRKGVAWTVLGLAWAACAPDAGEPRVAIEAALPVAAPAPHVEPPAPELALGPGVEAWELSESRCDLGTSLPRHASSCTERAFTVRGTQTVELRQDASGRMLERRGWDGGGDATFEDRWTYDGARLTTHTRWERSRWDTEERFDYDVQGREIRALTTTSFGGGFESYRERLTDYDEAGRVLARRELQGDSHGLSMGWGMSLAATWQYAYGEHGLVRVDGYDAQGQRDDYVLTREYHPNGQLQREREDDHGIERLVEYDAEGRLLRGEYSNHSSTQVTVYEYDAQGRVAAELSPYGTVRGSTRFTYDTAGRVIEVRREWEGINGDAGRYTLRHVYDCRGDLFRTDSDDGQDGVIDVRIAYVRDPAGNVLEERWSGRMPDWAWTRRTYDYGCHAP